MSWLQQLSTFAISHLQSSGLSCDHSRLYLQDLWLSSFGQYKAHKQMPSRRCVVVMLAALVSSSCSASAVVGLRKPLFVEQRSRRLQRSMPVISQRQQQKQQRQHQLPVSLQGDPPPPDWVLFWQRLGADVIAASTAAVCVSPFIAVFDRCVVS